MRAQSLVVTLFASLLFYGTSQTVAQTGTLTGHVANQSTLEPLPGANVQILSTTLGGSSDPDGHFRIDGVSPGTYSVKVSLVGFAPKILSDIVIASGRNTDLSVRMTESVIGIEQVEVTANYFQRTPDAPVSVQKLSYEEIRRSPGGFEDVVRAISVLPGVAVAQPGRNDLVVRGGSPAENLFVVDNIEIPNINHFGTQGASGGPLSFINLDFVRETSFSTGGFGVRYGDRMSSVLTIDMQDGRTDRLGGKGTIAATQFGANVQGPIDGSGSFIFSARRSYLDLIFRAAGFAFVPEYWDFLGRATYELDKSNSLTFLGIGAIDDVSFLNASADNRFSNSRVLGTAERQYATGSSWRHLYGMGYSTVTLDRSYVEYNGTQRDSLLNPIFSNQSTEAVTGIRADMVMQISKSTEISFGLSGKYVNFQSSLALPKFVTPFGDTLEVRPVRYAAIARKAAAYAQVSQKFFDHLIVTLGGRLDYFSMIEHSAVVAPRGSVAYEFSPLTTATVSTGEYYQSPSYIWLVANPGNTRLNFARATQYIVGVEHLLAPDLKVRVEVFQKDYDNYPASLDRRYLVLANTGAGYGGAEENFAEYGLDNLTSGGKGRAMGIEFLMQKKLSDTPLYGLVSVTYGRSRFTALDGIGRDGSFDQPFILTASGGYRFDDQWEASAKFRASSGQPTTPFNVDGTQNVAAYNTVRVKAAHSLDIRVDRRWNFAAWNLIAYIDLQNIYNNKFTGAVRWNARERKVEDNNESIGILPSIGVSAEF